MADNSLLSLENIQMPFSAEAEQAVLGSILSGAVDMLGKK